MAFYASPNPTQRIGHRYPHLTHTEQKSKQCYRRIHAKFGKENGISGVGNYECCEYKQ